MSPYPCILSVFIAGDILSADDRQARLKGSICWPNAESKMEAVKKLELTLKKYRVGTKKIPQSTPNIGKLGNEYMQYSSYVTQLLA